MEALQAKNSELAKEHAEVQRSYTEMKMCGWGEREKVRLRSLEHFHARILNAQMHCADDKEYLDSILTEAGYVLNQPKAGGKR